MISTEDAENELQQIKNQLSDIMNLKNTLLPAPKKLPKKIITDEEKAKMFIEEYNFTNEQKSRIIKSMIAKINIERINKHVGKGARSKQPIYNITWEVN